MSLSTQHRRQIKRMRALYRRGDVSRWEYRRFIARCLGHEFLLGL
jgi:hypothetical protein